jgi:hypothetical protein
MFAKISRAMSHYDHDGLGAAFTQIVQARLDDSGVSERKKWLECAHPSRLPGGEKNG